MSDSIRVQSDAPAVELRELVKTYVTSQGILRANDKVSLTFQSGSIHGIVGENGAGKSTAMKLLYGLEQPDSGTICIDGKPLSFRSPAHAIAAGVGMVHQHFMLAASETVLDNILLGESRSWWVNRSHAREKVSKLADRYGFLIDWKGGWDAKIEDLSVGVQQRIEILKLLYKNARILIFDEPTAVLTPQEISALFVQMRRLRDEGKTLLLITHKLKEVLEVTDEVSVLRAGKVTAQMKTADATAERIAHAMVGRSVELRVSQPAKNNNQGVGETVLKYSSFSVGGAPLVLRAGEILGIAGVEGNGQAELMRETIAALTQKFKCRAAYAWVPEDRLREGVLKYSSLLHNFLLGRQYDRRFFKCVLGMKWIRWKALRDWAVDSMERFDVRPRDLNALAGGLSGGNQQKLVFARELSTEAKAGRPCVPVLLAAHPTRGVDIGAIENIHRQVLAARDSGSAVLLVSSELDELFTLSDRLCVLYHGAVAAQYVRSELPGGEYDEKEIGLKMGGLQ